MASAGAYSAWGPQRGGDLALVGDDRPRQTLFPPYGWRDFLTLAFKEKWLLLVVFSTTLGLAVLASFAPSVKYIASSRLLILLSREYTFRPQVGSDTGSTLALDNAHIMRSEVEILSNPDLKRQVVRNFGQKRLYPFLATDERSEEAARGRFDAAVKNLAANLKIEPVPGSNVVRVSFAHPDPQLAADVLNALVEAYLESRRELYGQRGSELLVAQRDDFARRLSDAEEAMEGLRLKNDITVLEEQRLLLLRNQMDLEAARRDTATRVREATAKLENLSGSMSKVAQTVPLYSEHSSTAAVESAKARLLELQLRRKELRARFTEDSRFVTDVNDQIAIVQRFLSDQKRRRTSTRRVGPNPTYEGLMEEAIRLGGEVDSLRARQASLDEQVPSLERARASLEQVEREYRELALNRQIVEQQYQAYAGKAEEARILENLDRSQAANIRIIDKAVPPTEGRRLQPLIIMVGVVAGVVTALAAALFREFTRTTFVTPQAVERALGLPVLVLVPLKHQYRSPGTFRTPFASG